MRTRRRAIVASSLLAALLLLAIGVAIDTRLSDIRRVAIDSIDDPAAQERDEATPASTPIVHRGGEAAAGVAVAPTRAVGRLTPLPEAAVSLGGDLVPVPRAPPAV